jgi:hypothetical protein
VSHGTLTKIRNLGLCTILFAGMGAADASTPDIRWSGVLKADKDMTRVMAMRRGEMLRLRFGEPYNCEVPAELLDENADEALYRFNPPPNGGGFCAGLYPGGALIRAGESALHLSFERSGRVWSGDLAPSPAPWGKL